jgi:hypothetical protein
MTDKKTPYYAEILTGAQMVIQLDEDIYTTAVQTATGIVSPTEPPAGVKIPISIRYALLSGKVERITVKVEKGSGASLKKRSIGILCEVAKLPTVRGLLKDAVIKLGNGAGVNWTIM